MFYADKKKATRPKETYVDKTHFFSQDFTLHLGSRGNSCWFNKSEDTPTSLTTTIYVQYLEDMYYSLWHKCANYSPGLWRWLQVEPCRMVGHFCWAQPGWRVVDSLIKQGWCALTTCTCSPGVTKKSLKHCHIGLTCFKWYLGNRLLQVGCVQLAKNPCK